MQELEQTLKLAAATVPVVGSLIAHGISTLRDLSVESRREKELLKALAVVELPDKLSDILKPDLREDLVKEIDISVRQHLNKLKDLSARLDDPVYKLNGVDRVFLHFEKPSSRIRLPLVLTYVCAISAAIAFAVGLVLA